MCKEKDKNLTENLFCFILLIVFASGCLKSTGGLKSTNDKTASNEKGILKSFSLSNVPATATLGSSFNLVVTAKDAANNTVTNYAGAIHFASSDSNSPILPSDYTFVSDDNGSRSFPITLNSTGNQTVTVAVAGSGSPSVTSSNILVTAAATNSIAVSSGNSQSVVAGNPLSSSLVVLVKNSNNDPVAGITVNWSTTAGTLGVASSTTDANGLASNTLNPGTVAGSKTITATIQGTVTSATFTATVLPGGASASTSTIAASPLSISAGSTATVTMTVKDQYGNAIPNQTTSFVSTGTTNTITQLVSVTDSNGQVTGTIRSTLAEVKTISFGLPAALSGVNTTLTFNSDSVSSFALSGVAASLTAGTVSSVTVTAKDQFSNTVPTYTGTITFSSSDLQATLPADYTFVSGDNGVKTISGIILKKAGNQSVTATDNVTPSITGAQTGITVNAGVADHLVMVEGDAQQELPNVNLAVNPKVKVVDAYNNAVAGINLTFTPDSKASVGSGSLTSDANGFASTTMKVLYSGINNDLGVGSVVVTSGAALAGSPSSLTFTSKLKPNQIILSVGDNQVYEAGKPNGINLFIRAKYILVNIPDETIDWSSAAGGTFSANSGVTGATDGRLGVTFYPLNTEGTYTQDVTAQLRGSVLNYKFSYTVTAGTATNLSIVSGDNQSVAPQTSLTLPLVVSATDQFGNKNGIRIDWSITDGSITTLASTTNGSGETSNSSFITPAAAGNYLVMAKAREGSATVSFNVNVTGGCSVNPLGSPITPSVAVSRISGVAPLSVFFDASGTTHPTFTSKPFHELEYRWNFGDNAGINWNYGARPGEISKNTAIGPVAAHVYYTPGTYTISMTATDGTDSVTNACTQIVVQDPEVIFAGANTYCFSGTGSFVGCPAGANEVTITDYATAINTYKGTGKRLLFNRGETFTASLVAKIDVTGPGILGAYGAGNRPKFQFLKTGTNADMLYLSSSTTPGIKDWRIMDLEFIGEGVVGGSADTDNERGIVPAGGIDQITLTNLYLHNLHNPFHWNSANITNAMVAAGHTLWDQLTIIDSETANVSGCSSALSFYGSAKRMAFLGNYFSNSLGGEHTVRIPSVQKSVFSNNLFEGQGACAGGKHSFTVRSTDVTDTASAVEEWRDTYHTFISDNKFMGSYKSDYIVSLAPQASYKPDAVGAQDKSQLIDTIMERNYFQSSDGINGTQSGLYVSANKKITIRNNLFNTNLGKSHNGILVKNTYNETDGVDVYNNTFYSNEAAGNFTAVALDQNVASIFSIQNVIIKNNLAYAPSDTQAWMINSNVAFTASGNSCNTDRCQAPKTLNPNFASSPMVNNADWTPSAVGYASGNGVMSPVWSDFFGDNRSNATFDMGAIIPQ